MEGDDPRGEGCAHSQFTRLNTYLVRLHGDSPMIQHLEMSELSLIVHSCGIKYAETLEAEVNNLMWNWLSAEDWRKGKRYDDLLNEGHGLVVQLDDYFPKGIGDVIANYVGHDALNPSIFTAFCWWTELLITTFNSPVMTLEVASQLFSHLKERRVEYTEDQGSWRQRILCANDEMINMLNFAFV